MHGRRELRFSGVHVEGAVDVPERRGKHRCRDVRQLSELSKDAGPRPVFVPKVGLLHSVDRVSSNAHAAHDSDVLSVREVP